VASDKRTAHRLARRTVLASAFAAVGLFGATGAFASADLVDLKVVDRDTGRPLQMWRRHGRLYIAGEQGERYSLRVTNRTGARVLVVLSVDGVNILSGETASYNQRGYVFDPYQSYDVNGWRKSNTEVAAFSFAPLPQSYAARTGRPTDVGVIGMAVFREKVAPVAVTEPPRISPYDRAAPDEPLPAPPPPPAPRAPSSDTATLGAPARAESQPSSKAYGGSLAMRQEERLGTAHGEREWSAVDIVPFERATPYPQMVRQIEYDSWSNLVARGVIYPRYAEHRPRPFPSAGEGYVPDPPQE
jgi:hypothetical protein